MGLDCELIALYVARLAYVTSLEMSEGQTSRKLNDDVTN
jgi:hypothetical protein